MVTKRHTFSRSQKAHIFFNVLFREGSKAYVRASQERERDAIYLVFTNIDWQFLFIQQAGELNAIHFTGAIIA